MNEWKTIARPGYFGRKKEEKIAGFNENYGEGNWRIMWQWGENIIPWEISCLIYEDGYYADSFKREGLWKDLASKAREVYDYVEDDVLAALDYSKQKKEYTHLQDISIRRVVLRRGWKFEGSKLIRIRHHDNYWGANLSPGKIAFQSPELIVSPHLENWWNQNSVEDFYQSNKVLQIRQD